MGGDLKDVKGLRGSSSVGVHQAAVPFQVHSLGIVYSDVLDTKLHQITNVWGNKTMESILHSMTATPGLPHNRIPFERFQRYAGILDVDGEQGMVY